MADVDNTNCLSPSQLKTLLVMAAKECPEAAMLSTKTEYLMQKHDK